MRIRSNNRLPQTVNAARFPPGMESAKPVPYDTLLVQADGRTREFARH